MFSPNANSGDVEEAVMNNEKRYDLLQEYRRISFNKSAVKKIMKSTNSKLRMGKTTPIVISGITKTYLTEIILLANQLRINDGEAKITPNHLRRAYQAKNCL